MCSEDDDEDDGPLKGGYLGWNDPPDWMRQAQEKGGKVRITTDTANTLRAMGVPVPAWVEIQDPTPEELKEIVYVCRAMPKGAPPGLPGNLEADCAWCGTNIQHRSYAPAGVTKVCDTCAKLKAESGN